MRFSRLRFTVRQLMIAVASIALALASVLWMYRSAVEIVEIAPHPARANVDHDIFDVVLADLLINQEFNPAVGGRGVAKSEIVLGDTTLRGSGRDISDSDPWMTENKVSPEILDDLAARNPWGTRYSLARYRPTDPNILVRDMGGIDTDLGFSAQFPKARGYIEIDLPGYSQDGRTALIYFSFGPTPHGADGYYLLKKVGGRWEVVGRSIRYYS